MKRFLIVKPSSLGDVIHAFPAVSMLAHNEPEAKIDWLVAPAFAPIVRYHPAVDNVILFRRKELGKLSSFPGAFAELFAEIRKNRYDAVIDLQGLLRSALISRLAKTHIVAGPAVSKERGIQIFYKQKLNPGEKFRHAVRKNMAMMAEFLNIPEPENAVFEIKRNPEAEQHLDALMQGFPKEKLIALAPGARWASKQWPPEFFANVINLFHRDNPDYSFMILGSPDERPLSVELEKHLEAPVINLTGKTGIPELLETIRRSALLMCNDSGPMHIAAALGIPLVCMFGPTDPVLTGPFADRAEVLIPNLECIKCFKRECERALCHKAVSPEIAKKSIENLLRI